MSNGFKATAFWTQAVEGGVREPGQWLRVMEPTTKLDSPWGPVAVSEEAHIKAIPLWKQGVFAHVDHNYEDKNKEFPLKVLDVKYEPGRGLYLKIDGDREEVKMLMKGVAKPSIEINVPKKEHYDGKYRRITEYKPTGLGIMIEGTPNGKNVGPDEPDFAEAIGGKPKKEGDNMPENEIDEDKVKEVLTNFEKEVKDKKPEEVKTLAEEHRKKLKELFGEKDIDFDTDVKFVDIFKSATSTESGESSPNGSDSDDKGSIGNEDYKKLLNQMKSLKEESVKKDELLKQMKSFSEQTEKLLIEKTIEEAKKDGVHVEILNLEGKSYDEVVKEIDAHKKLVETYNLSIPKEDNPNPGGQPPVIKLFDEKTGYVDDKAFAEATKKVPFFKKDDGGKYAELFKKGD